MVFTKRLREGIRHGDITCSVRIWTRPHVRAGGRYRMDEGEIEVDSIEPIGFPDITPELARESGFLRVLDLLKVAQHGRGSKFSLFASTMCRARSSAQPVRLWDHRSQRSELGVSKPETRGAHIFIEVLHVSGSGNGQHERRPTQQPRQRDNRG
jgi:hypothetical protein